MSDWFSKLVKRFGLVLAIIIASFGAVGKGKVKVKKDECGGRDSSGNKKKNEKVRDANKAQKQNPDPNATK